MKKLIVLGLTSILGISVLSINTYAQSKYSNLKEVEFKYDLMKDRVVGAVILVIISVVLTVLAGFIPAKIAAKKDPVEALRSE